MHGRCARAVALGCVGVFAAVSLHAGLPQHLFVAPVSLKGEAGSSTVASVSARRLQGVDAHYVTSTPSTSTASLSAALAAGILAFSSIRVYVGRQDRASRVARKITMGKRDVEEKLKIKTQYPRKKNYQPGQYGYSSTTPVYTPPPGPARMTLSHVGEPITSFLPSDFYKAPFAKLSRADVKNVGSVTLYETAPAEMPANLPTYVHPRDGSRMEKEPGAKRPPSSDNDAYEAYIEKNCCTLMPVAEMVASKQDLSLTKDWICDRSAFVILLRYLNENLSDLLMKKGHHKGSVDLVKISRKAGSSTLVLDTLYEEKNLWAEFRPYRGAWKRSEASHHGTYTPAFLRVCTGDTKVQNYMVTGIKQVIGSSGSEIPKHYNFVEFELGGMSFASRSQIHAKDGDKVVDLKHKNYYFRQDVRVIDMYLRLLLGGADMQGVGFQRSGKLVKAIEFTLEDLVEKHSDVVPAAERRLGRIASLLQQVKQTLEGKGEGEWVLQWQQGQLVLGSYEKPAEPEPTEEEQA